MQVFIFLILAALVTLAWSLLDRKRKAHPRLFQGLRVWVRFYLASVMITYGAVKVIQSQFPAPTLDRLIQPYGDSSPMGILWTFMGASRGYNFFAGAGELLGGLLLTTRRTTLLGALVTVGVMSNVAALNFCYDVPVKLFSTHLIVMAVFLAAPDLRRLIDFLVLGRAVGPVEYRPFLGRWKALRPVALGLRSLAVVGFTGVLLYTAQDGRKKYGDLAPRSPLYGIWNVEDLEADGKPRPPLVTDTDRWRRVVFDYPKMIAIQLMSDNRQRYTLNLDEEKKTLALGKRDDANWKSDFTYSQPEDGILTLEGTFDGKKIRARLRRADESSFLLRTRGFHWISEYPFNR